MRVVRYTGQGRHRVQVVWVTLQWRPGMKEAGSRREEEEGGDPLVVVSIFMSAQREIYVCVWVGIKYLFLLCLCVCVVSPFHLFFLFSSIQAD